ncbi:MAG: helix-turn-helix transcriptional regulator [Tyzzerella sp.]|nr:helix-turn-helix transcriptional regulator [Tyzzerella sp.]
MFFFDINIPSSHGYICENKIFDEPYVSRLHWHGFIEMEFVISGRGINQYYGSDYPFKRGDAWILTVHDSHKVICEQGLNVIKISIKPEILHGKLQKHLSLSHPLKCSFEEEEFQFIQNRLKDLLYEQEHPQMLSRVKASSIINELVVEMARKSSINTTPPKLGIIQDVIAWLQANYKNDISLAQIADIFSLTPNYLGRLFKNAMGMSYNDYLNSLRLKNACHLLSISDSSIKEIAAESGFNSVEYFNSIFKKYYGATPSQYRMLATKKH